MSGLTRRKLLAGGIPLAGAGAAVLHSSVPHRHPWDSEARAAESHHAGQGEGHAAFRGGVVDPRVNGFDPHETLRSFDWGTTRRLASGRVLREWEIHVAEREIEVA